MSLLLQEQPSSVKVSHGYVGANRRKLLSVTISRDKIIWLELKKKYRKYARFFCLVQTHTNGHETESPDLGV